MTADTITREEFDHAVERLAAALIFAAEPPISWLRGMRIDEALHGELLQYIDREIASDGGYVVDVATGASVVRWRTIEDALVQWQHDRECAGLGTAGAEAALLGVRLMRRWRTELEERAIIETRERGEDPFAQVFQPEVLQ